MGNSHFNIAGACAGFAVLALIVLAMPAQAADAIFPPGSRIGLVPPAGMVASDAFAGFADPSTDAAILITALPTAAYAEIEKTLDTEALKKQGMSVERREAVQLGGGKGFLLVGRQLGAKARYRKWLLVADMGDLTALVIVQVPDQGEAYTDRAVRAALSTLSVRASVPQAEQLSLLPFTVGELAGFHVEGVLRGRAVVLSDAQSESPNESTKEAPAGRVDAHLLVAAVPGGPSDMEDHANFARLAFNEIAGIRDVHITMSEPLRSGGQTGYQTMADAKDARTGADVKVVQWLRFGNGGFLQMVGIGRVDNWPSVLARLRMVRDSVETK